MELGEIPVQAPYRQRRIAIGHRWAATRSLFWRQRAGTTAAVVFGLIVILAAASPFIAPYDENAAIARPFLNPGSDHLLGTDHLGRDMLSRVLVGARVSLLAGVGAVVLSLCIGVPLGLISGFLGGTVDLFLQRVVDVMLTIPALILALVLIAVLGPGLTKVVIAIGLVESPRVARIVRGTVTGLRSNQYVEAARSTGCSTTRVMVRHILPNVVPVILTLASSLLGAAIIVEASLSFLGLGILPPTPSWGGMLSSGVQTYFVAHPWLAVPPGLAITITVLAANILGDAIQEETDPRLRAGR